MIKSNLIYSRKLFLIIIVLLFLVLLVFIAFQGYYEMDRDIKINSAGTKDMIDQRISSLLFEINIFPQDIGDDLIFLSKISCLKKIINSEKDSALLDEGIKGLKNDFLNFMKGSEVYYHVRYIDETGQEIVRVDYSKIGREVISEDELQNKASRYYFKDAMKLKKEEVYISELDLNLENGEIENRGTEENPRYVPVIRTATNVFNEANESKGILVINVYADYFLDDIRRSQREGETVVLVNPEGYYLAHPEGKKEFSFMFENRDYNIYTDYLELPEDIFFDFDKRRYETEDRIFSFKRVHPTLGDFVIHRGSESVHGENPEKEYFWILVTITDKKEMNKFFGEIKSNYFYFLLFTTVIMLIIIFLVFLLAFKISNGGKRKKWRIKK